jgi:hypothetical protein
MAHKVGCQVHEDHHGFSLTEEILSHLPYAIMSVALALVTLSFMDFMSPGQDRLSEAAHNLFHAFHFLHIVFAATGTFITFSRYSQKIVTGLLVASIGSLTFCTLSDVILPSIAGAMLGVPIHMHICLFSEWNNILPFLFVGLLNGVIMSRHDNSVKSYYSVASHFVHILVSSLASLFYMVAEDFTDWYSQFGLVFLLLIVAVLVPCTLADLVVPSMCARVDVKR